MSADTWIIIGLIMIYGDNGDYRGVSCVVGIIMMLGGMLRNLYGA